MDNSVPNDPLDLPAPVQSANLPTEEGTVYGSAPKEPNDPPDIDLLLEYADIPGGREGGLPFSLEWYAGAKDRQKARDAEKERLETRKTQLRGGWTKLVEEDLTAWIGKVDLLTSDEGNVQGAEAMRGLAELIARAATETPDDTELNQRLEEALDRAIVEDDLITRELLLDRSGLQQCLDAVLKSEEEAIAEDEARAEAKSVAEARRLKAEEELRRQECLLRGEDPDAPPVAEAASGLPPLPPGGLPQASPARSPTVTPPEGSGRKLSRGGLAMELPPLHDPPRPGGGSARGRMPSPPL